ncbi:hypothetical protein ACCS44_29770 [Rhizobium ruizarguesonis]
MTLTASVDGEPATSNQTPVSPHYFVFLHHQYHVSRSELDDIIRKCHAGLRHVAAYDPDHARQLNGVGFSVSDQSRGHRFAKAPVQAFLQNEVRAMTLIQLAIKYRRQIPMNLRFDPDNRQGSLPV